MNFLNIILLTAMALSVIHCGSGAEPKPYKPTPQPPELKPLILVHNASNDENVYYSFDGSTDKGFIVEPGTCIRFSGSIRGKNLGNLTIWATSGGFSNEPKVLCGGETPCTDGNYKITDTLFTIWDSYKMELLTEELDEKSCLWRSVTAY